MPPATEVQEAPAIADCDFQRLVRRAEQRELTEPEFQQVVDDRERAVRKRKHAVMEGRPADAASASSREQTSTRGILVPYAQSGVRSRPGQKKGVRASAEIARERGARTKTEVHNMATQLLQSHSKHEISGMICKRLDRTRTQVLKHLRDHPSGHWIKE